ncbi:hypothetical protein J0A68_06480 [Algoriphagus sp. H41]|uniref:DUF4175 domain-containing protein n=1 Tax=Algoriphagus oliviformis TaxID=2811231 RepID=A0ABS3C0I8_9BACT|nr:hypothetical protein [Algoriphagus oliviformis]MBN7810591.1 hypothetical protein [Algoriphagus oliviformis]
MKTLNQHIKSLENQLWLNAWLKGLLCSVVLGSLLSIFGLNGLARSGVVGGAGAILAIYFGAFRPQRARAVRILHERVGGLEFSLELLEKGNPSIVERLQLDRIASRIPPKIWVFHKGLTPFLLSCGVVMAFSLLLNFLPITQKSANSNSLEKERLPAVLAENAPVLLSQSQVQIAAPSYTGIAPQEQTSLDIKAIKGSNITWSLGFESADNLSVFLVSSTGAMLPFSKDEDRYQLKEELTGSGIYSIQAFRGEAQVFESKFYTLEAIVDQSPQILPEEKESYKFFFPGNDPKLQLKAQVSDDFRVSRVEIVATLARGKGENVKFRETRFPVETKPFSSKQSTFTLNVNSLDFQPGDELYYYWVAADNKAPEANISRTDTYFIKYFDDSEESNAVLEGMAIQVLPEYFRSQRQIIIDTEKLLADKPKLAEKKFNSTSNEIGYDQKLLRLRYGQYLGEEFETAAVGVVVEPTNDGDMLAGYMHLHDQEGEHDPDPAKPGQFGPTVEHQHETGGHDHGHESEEGDAMEDLMSAYIHAHDSEEMNTFYEQSTRGALKGALEQMWQAELHMRLFEPEKALPYQYKALELLKSVQQKSRVYVKRTAYDPPPIKEEEKRLSGELEELDLEIQKELAMLDRQIEPLASAVLGFLAKAELSAQERETVRELGSLWTKKAQNSQLADLNLILHLQELEAGKLDEKGRRELRDKLYPLAKNYKNPGASTLANESLKSAFRKNLR